MDLLNDKHKQWGRSKFRKLGGSKPFQVEDVGRHQDRLFYELWRGERGFGAQGLMCLGVKYPNRGRRH